jgi:hypothetical protein
MQLAVLSNHQNGRDTHIRQIKIYGPRQWVSTWAPPVRVHSRTLCFSFVRLQRLVCSGRKLLCTILCLFILLVSMAFAFKGAIETCTSLMTHGWDSDPVSVEDAEMQWLVIHFSLPQLSSVCARPSGSCNTTCSKQTIGFTTINKEGASLIETCKASRRWHEVR